MDAETATISADFFLREVPDVKTRLVHFFSSNLISRLICSLLQYYALPIIISWMKFIKKIISFCVEPFKVYVLLLDVMFLQQL